MLLISGTAGAQLITAAAMPVISRLYSPADIGLLAVFTGLLTTIAVAAGLRFDVAVALPSGDDDAAGLLVLSIIAAGGVALLLAVAALLFGNQLASLLQQPALAKHLWMLPLAVFCSATYATLQAWNIRQQGFRHLVRARVGQAVAAALIQIAGGVIAGGLTGLLGGYVLGVVCGALVLGWSILRRPPEALRGLTRRQLTGLMKRYERFPRLSTWEALANNGAIQLPIVMIGALAAPAEAGYLTWAIYVVQAPMTLVGTAVGQVYLSRAPGEHAQGRLAEFTTEVIGRLLKVGLGPLIALGILAPTIFKYLFGPGWERAGWLVAWMIPWFALQFVASPVSMALHVLERGHAAMLFQIYGLLVRVAAVIGAAKLFPAALSPAYSVSGALVYGTLFLIVVRSLRIPTPHLGSAVKQSLPATARWTIGAVIALAIARWAGLA